MRAPCCSGREGSKEAAFIPGRERETASGGSTAHPKAHRVGEGVGDRMGVGAPGRLPSQVGPVVGAASGPCFEGSEEPSKVSELGNDSLCAGGTKESE